jgi:hypothetical protein
MKRVAIIFVALMAMIAPSRSDQIDYYLLFSNAAAAQADPVVGAVPYWNGTNWNTSITFPNTKLVTAQALINGISSGLGFWIIISLPTPDAAVAGRPNLVFTFNRDAGCRLQSFVLSATVTGTARTLATTQPVPAGSCYPQPLGQ